MRIQNPSEQAILRNHINLIHTLVTALSLPRTAIRLRSPLLLIPCRRSANLSQLVIVPDVSSESESPDHHAECHAPANLVIRFLLPLGAGCGAIACEPAAD